MNNVEFLCGDEQILNTSMQPFVDDVCMFLNSLSSLLFKAPESRIYPDLAAFAFWCRKANIQKLKENYNDIDSRLGRGLCFHIAPSNIPINSFFSFVFSLLAGNANIVRLPSKTFPQLDYLTNVVTNLLEEFPDIKARTAFVKYPKDSDATESFSAVADCRMIWGGDSTIATVKACKAKPMCVDIAFADRYSICIIDAEFILNTSKHDMERLSENFYNDTYLMDQKACSSPQLIYWLHDCEAGREKFWTSVFDYSKRKYELQDAIAVDKYTKFCLEAIENDNIEKISRRENILYLSEIKALKPSITENRGNAGYFYEYSLNDFEELIHIVTEKYQTVTYYGIDKALLRKQLIHLGAKGVDRIVPIGNALNIDIIWDGHDIVRELSKVISVQ